LPPEGPLAARRLPADPKQDALTYRRFVAIRLAHYAEEMAEARTNCHRADGSAPVLHYLAGSIGSGKTLLSAPLRRQLGIAESAWVDVDRYLPSLPKDHARLVTMAREAIRQWLPDEDDADLAMGLIPAANEPLPELQVAYLLSNADWRRGLDARQNLLVETTFSLAGRFDQVLESIRAGAVVDLDYVGVHDLDTLVQRVQSRALGSDRVGIPEAQIERNLFSGFTYAALVAHLARRLRVYDNRATMDLNLQADYQPPLLLEIERGVILRQSTEPLPWWAEILRDVALGADMGVDMDALYH
jgi:Zeta toxin.